MVSLLVFHEMGHQFMQAKHLVQEHAGAEDLEGQYDKYGLFQRSEGNKIRDKPV